MSKRSKSHSPRDIGAGIVPQEDFEAVEVGLGHRRPEPLQTISSSLAESAVKVRDKFYDDKGPGNNQGEEEERHPFHWDPVLEERKSG